MNDLNSLLENAVDESAGRESVKEEKDISKSKRIRLYMKQHPGVRNKDVVAALSHHGVKAADVANVKSQLKRKAGKQGSKLPSHEAGKIVSRPAAAPMSVDATVGLDVLEAGIAFVERAGGMNEAQHVLNVIKRIRSI